MKNIEEIRSLSIGDLKKEIRTLSRELFEIKIKIHTGQEKDISKYNKIKKQIAKYKTILKEIELNKNSLVKK